MVKFCPVCEKSLEVSFGTTIIFKCPVCQTVVPSTPEDVRMPTAFHATEENIELWNNIRKNAPFDRVTEKVKKDCPQCKRDYLTMLRLGKNEYVVYACKCGYDSSGENKEKKGASEKKFEGKKCAWVNLVMKGDKYIPGALVAAYR